MKAGNNPAQNDLSQNNTNNMMPAAAGMTAPSNAMQFGANPFETPTNLDLNSQNLGNNLAATAGMPNEGIMQNPTTAPSMQMASAVAPEMAAPAIPSMAPATQPMMAADPMTAPTPSVPAAPANDFSMPAPSINSIPDMTMTPTINSAPVVSEPVSSIAMNPTVPAMPPVETAMPAAITPEPAMATAPTITQPAAMNTTMSVNSVNSSGMDTSAQPVNPVSTSVGVQDPAGIFSQAATAPATEAAAPEPTIAELPNVPAESAITDLTPDQNVQAAVPAPSDMQLPQISEIDLTPKVEAPAPASTPEPAAPAPITPEPTNVTPTNNGLPPLNNLVNTPAAMPAPVAPAAITPEPVMSMAAPAMPTMNPATIAQPIAPATTGLGMQPDPLLNQQPAAAPAAMPTTPNIGLPPLGTVTPPQA